jgi:hypothetical protein
LRPLLPKPMHRQKPSAHSLLPTGTARSTNLQSILRVRAAFWREMKQIGKICTSGTIVLKTTSCSTARSWLGCAKAGGARLGGTIARQNFAIYAFILLCIYTFLKRSQASDPNGRSTSVAIRTVPQSTGCCPAQKRRGEVAPGIRLQSQLLCGLIYFSEKLGLPGQQGREKEMKICASDSPANKLFVAARTGHYAAFDCCFARACAKTTGFNISFTTGLRR